jgi:hypothetical protein
MTVGPAGGPEAGPTGRPPFSPPTDRPATYPAFAPAANSRMIRAPLGFELTAFSVNRYCDPPRRTRMR